MLATFRKVLQTFEQALFPERCFGCGRRDSLLCLTCQDSLEPATLPDHPNSLSIFSYKDPKVRAGIQRLKYKNRTPLATVFAKLMVPHLLEEFSDQVLFRNFTEPLLVPVPLSRSRLRARGYNHSALLAKELAQETHFEYRGELVEKIRDTAPQVSQKSKRMRLENLRGAFLVCSPLVEGRNCIIVDDVTTTGTTIEEVSAALKAGGAKKVFAVTIAH